jgi:hypothetical protein
MSDLIGFDEGDDEIVSGDVDSYRGEGGVTDLLSLCWFYEDDDGNYRMGEDDTPKFKVSKCHYIEGKGYIKHNDYLQKKKGQPKTRIGTFVVKYKTDDAGNLEKPFDYKVLPWEFGADKFRDLKKIHSSFPLTRHDFKSDCKGEKFQKLTFFPSKQEALWQQKDKVKEDVLEKVESLANSGTLSLAREVPLEELKDHFGEAPSPAPEDDAADTEEFEEFMDDI